MAFQKEWNSSRKKELPNKLRKNPIISPRLNLSQLAYVYLNNRKKTGERTRFILGAIETKVFIETDKRFFLKQMLENNYPLCRHLLRKIGERRTH
jgi:hypothetical protein